MVDAIVDMVPLYLPYVQYNNGKDGSSWGHRRGGNAGFTQRANVLHPLGRHPVNIITEEIYG